MRRRLIVALSFCIAFVMTVAILIATPGWRDLLTRRTVSDPSPIMIRVWTTPAPKATVPGSPDDSRAGDLPRRAPTTIASGHVAM